MVVSTFASEAEPALRLRRPGWRNPRLLVGLVLLFGSIALVSRVVAEAGHLRTVYTARTALPPGTALTVDVLQVARVRVEGTDAGYLDADSPLPTGAVLIRTVGAGELIPTAAIGSAADLTVRPVVIPLDGAPPTGLSAGGRADIWAAAPYLNAGRTGFRAPDRIAAEVEVFAVSAPGTGLESGRSGSLQVLVPEATLPELLDALANGARLSVLPVLGSPGAEDLR